MNKSSTLRLAGIRLRVAESLFWFIGILFLAGCAAPREWRISGICRDPGGKPKVGVAIKHIDFGRRIPIGAMLPPEYVKATAITDDKGKFVLVVRTSRPWVLQVDEPTNSGFVPGSARIKMPEDLIDRRELSLHLSIDHGRIVNKWERAIPEGQAAKR